MGQGKLVDLNQLTPHDSKALKNQFGNAPIYYHQTPVFINANGFEYPWEPEESKVTEGLIPFFNLKTKIKDIPNIHLSDKQRNFMYFTSALNGTDNYICRFRGEYSFTNGNKHTPAISLGQRMMAARTFSGFTLGFKPTGKSRVRAEYEFQMNDKPGSANIIIAHKKIKNLFNEAAGNPQLPKELCDINMKENYVNGVMVVSRAGFDLLHQIKIDGTKCAIIYQNSADAGNITNPKLKKILGKRHEFETETDGFFSDKANIDDKTKREIITESMDNIVPAQFNLIESKGTRSPADTMNKTESIIHTVLQHHTQDDLKNMAIKPSHYESGRPPGGEKTYRHHLQMLFDDHTHGLPTPPRIQQHLDGENENIILLENT